MTCYQNHVFCCTNQRPEDHPRGSCGGKNSLALRQYMAAKVKALGLPATRINTSGCLDQCEHGPVMVIYPEGVWYRYGSEADIDLIIQEHLVNGRLVESLLASASSAVK